jgi:hypothetical protein
MDVSAIAGASGALGAAGGSGGYMGMAKDIAGMATSGVNLIAGIGMAIDSAVKAKKSRKELQRLFPMIDARETELGNWFNKQYYQPVTQRTEVQDLLREMEDNQKAAETRAAAQAAVSGATPEQQMAIAEANRSSYADTLSNIAKNASTLRDTYLQNYLGQTGGLFNQRLSAQQGKANSFMQQANMLSQGSSNAFSAAAKALS